MLRWLGCLTLAACSFAPEPADTGEEPLGGARTVTGQVVDFATLAPVGGAASVGTAGITPAPRVSVQGAEFTIEDVPNYSVFYIQAGVTGGYRPTFGAPIEVTTADVGDIEAPAISEQLFAAMATEFQVTPSATHGVLLAQIVDESGGPRSGVAGTMLSIGIAGAEGPFFLDDNLRPDRGADASSRSGWVAFYEIPPGVIELIPGAGVTIEMPRAPVAASTITLAQVRVTDGAPPPPPPPNVSFATDIMPIFTRNGCIGCHRPSQDGAQLGGLRLEQSADKVYDELVVENSLRVQPANPEASLVLVKPLFEDPPNHQNAAFTSTSHPDYQLLLGWITAGAPYN